MVKVKFCGFTSAGDVMRAQALGVDYLGFNFCPRSRRRVDPARAAELAGLVTGALKVGVFVDAPAEEIIPVANDVGLDLVQLHGRETADFCRRLRRETGRPLIKAFAVTGPETARDALEYADSVDYLLLDAPGASPRDGFGGSGRTFPWCRAGLFAALGRPFFLAGGLTAANVADAVRGASPFAVDVAGGIEDAAGRKDARLMALFLEAVRAAEPGIDGPAGDRRH